MAKAILLYFSLLWVATSACEYGDPICTGMRTKIIWRCPEDNKRQLSAFWGRMDDETCVTRVPTKHLQNLNCTGDDKKAADAVTEWCESNVDSDGHCEVRAKQSKLRLGGEKYDPCPGTNKYLRVCTSCQPEPECWSVYTDITSYPLPFRAGGMTLTSSGHVVLVQNFRERAAMFNMEAEKVKEIIVPGARSLRDVTRDGDKLYISDSENRKVVVMHENGTYINSISINREESLSKLAVQGNTVWVSLFSGIYEIRFDAGYRVIASKFFSDCSNAKGIAVQKTRLVALCGNMRIEYRDINGTLLFPPVHDGTLINGSDLEMDECGQVYIADSGMFTKNIFLYSATGQFIKTLVTKQDGLVGYPKALYLKENYLLAATTFSHALQVIKLK